MINTNIANNIVGPH